MHRQPRRLAVALVVAVAACAGGRRPSPTSPDDYRTIVAAPDRTDADRALDAGRNPAALLAFAGIRPGMRVAELMAGGGYTTELLARAVAPDGRVWAQNNRLVLERFAATPWSNRLARPALRNVVRVDRELEDPLPPDAHDLDVVVMVLFYHDAVWMDVDRDRMNRAVYSHLRPGGLYVIVDHSGRPGTGTSEVKTLHRIDETAVRAEVERAGFRLARSADFLRNPADPRDWNDSPSAAGPRRGTSDRFVLAFERPG
jgi:predicted methyltransferase